MPALTKLVNLALNSAYGFPPKLPDTTSKTYKQLQDLKKRLSNRNH